MSITPLFSRSIWLTPLFSVTVNKGFFDRCFVVKEIKPQDLEDFGDAFFAPVLGFCVSTLRATWAA